MAPPPQSKRARAGASEANGDANERAEARRVCPHFTRAHAAQWQRRRAPSSGDKGRNVGFEDTAALLARYLASDTAVSRPCVLYTEWTDD